MRLRNRVIFAAGIIGVSLTAVIVPSAMAAQPLLPCQEGSLTNCQIPPHGKLGAKLSVTIEPTSAPLPTPTVTPSPTVIVLPTSTPLPKVPPVTVIVPPAQNRTTVIMPPLAPAPSITTDTLPVTH